MRHNSKLLTKCFRSVSTFNLIPAVLIDPITIMGFLIIHKQLIQKITVQPDLTLTILFINTLIQLRYDSLYKFVSNLCTD